jgi:ADP-heptose:LPS heptosyltransferase
MDAIEQVKKLIPQMDEIQRQNCVDLLKKAEAEDKNLEKDIAIDIEKLKYEINELSTDDWKEFCRRLNELCYRIKLIWKRIDRRQEIVAQAESAKRQEYVDRMLDLGFEFDQIVIEGERFIVGYNKRSKKITEEDDDIPF